MVVIIIIVIIIVVGTALVLSQNGTDDKYVPLLKFETIDISPKADFLGVSTIKNGETATITLNVKSLSSNYNNDGKIEISFEHEEDANQYFKIDKNIQNVGIIQNGGTSGPISFKITIIKDPGEYKDTILAKLLVNNNLNDQASFQLKME